MLIISTQGAKIPLDDSATLPLYHGQNGITIDVSSSLVPYYTLSVCVGGNDFAAAHLFPGRFKVSTE